MLPFLVEFMYHDKICIHIQSLYPFSAISSSSSSSSSYLPPLTCWLSSTSNWTYLVPLWCQMAESEYMDMGSGQMLFEAHSFPLLSLLHSWISIQPESVLTALFYWYRHNVEGSPRRPHKLLGIIGLCNNMIPCTAGLSDRYCSCVFCQQRDSTSKAKQSDSLACHTWKACPWVSGPTTIEMNSTNVSSSICWI